MMQTRVYIVDDDPVLREGLLRTFSEAGYPAQAFASGVAFLHACPALTAGCVILDLIMPGMRGSAVQRELAAAGYRWPVIVLTGHAGRPQMVRAMQAGSVFFLEKPVREAELFAAVLNAEAVLRGESRDPRELHDVVLAQAITLLSARERQVLQGLMESELSKQTAARLGISESTVKSCRKRIMRKLDAKSTSQLIQRAVLAGVEVKSRS